MPDFSGMGSSIGDNLLTAAKKANRAASGSTSHKIATLLRYTARKQVLNAPGTMATTVLGKVPIAGGLLSAIADKAVQALHDRDRRQKLAKYKEAVNQGGDDLEHLRKLAKWEAKSLKELAEKLESNMVKLKDAAIKTKSAYQTFVSNSSSEAAIDGVLGAACEEERYILKVALMVEGLRGAGDALGAYLDEAREANLKMQSDLVTALNAIAADNGTAINTFKPALPPRPGLTPPPPLPKGGGPLTPQQMMAKAGAQVANQANIRSGLNPPLPPRPPGFRG